MALRLALFYAALFAFVGVAMPYWPVWLAHRGLDAAEIAMLMAAATWIRIGVPSAIAHAADRRGARKPAMATLAAAAFAAHLLFLAADGFAALLLVSALAAAAFTPLIPMTENLTLLAARERRLDYGRVRLWGSIAFVAGAFGGGWALDEVGPPSVLAMVLVSLLAAAAAAFALPDIRLPPARHPLPVWALVKRPDMLLFLAAAALIQSSHAVYYVFSTLAWREAGIDDRLIGLLWAEGVAAEILLFALGGGLAARLGPTALLGIGAVAGVLRWSALALTADLWVLVPAQALHALTFGAAHLGAMQFLARRVDASRSASAQALYSGVTMGLALGGATLLAGALYARAGAGAYWAMALMAAAGGLAALALSRFTPDGSQRRERTG